MLEFAANPARVREATKLAYRYGIQLNNVADYWAGLPRSTKIPGFGFQLRGYQADGVAHLEKWDGNALIGDEPGFYKPITLLPL